MDNAEENRRAADTAEKLLKNYFGHDSFRTGQRQIIDELRSGRDVLGIMPTGGGKSICYQLPALMAGGVTLVVSPLISLMKDQVTALVQSGIRGAFYNSSLNEAQCRKALANMAAGMYKIIYVAPERLETERFLEVCRGLEISYIAVDEAHCVSQWGQDFRPSYLKIPEFINKLPRRPVIGAFTATATKAVRSDIVKLLGLKEPYVLTTGFDRPNLYFEVRHASTKAERFGELTDIIFSHSNKSGIIYCATRKAVDEVYERLSDMGLDVTRYHAGLVPEERKLNQEDFIFDRKPIVVATNAFGMGIDKSNVSFVVHYNMPKNIENYYQEAGRAGRDGSNADCILLYSPSDIFTIKYFINSGERSEELTDAELELIRSREIGRMNRMIDYCKHDGCLRNYILRYFGESPAEPCRNCSECLGYAKSRRAELPFMKKTAPALKPQAEIRAEVDAGLFEELRKMRIKLAKIKGVPTYVIFSDNTLRDICRKLPRNETELLGVSGIGRNKAERYGGAILEALRKYKA